MDPDAPSRPVRSSQAEPHPSLADTVMRHLRHPSRQPIPGHTEATWLALRNILDEAPARPLVLDAGCGTGASTHRLAQLHPAAWVVGVDRSAHRLGFREAVERRTDHIVLARAELGALYRLMARARIRLGAHYLLFPNPWPKSQHLMRRWHGHPAFPAMLSLGGRLEARSNWPLYLEELSMAIRWVTGATAQPGALSGPPLSPFERKYKASGHDLYRLSVTLRSSDRWPEPRR